MAPIGQAAVRRRGRSATLITYGPSVLACLEAAEAGRAEGWDLEVLDLRSLVPFDDDTVCASVRETGRAVIVHESMGFGYSCDNNMQLASDALAMSRAAADYSELRRELFYDSTQHAEEPPWRVCRRNSLAMSIRPRIHRCSEAALVISRDRRDLPARAEGWTFTAVANPHDPMDEGIAYPVTLYQFPKDNDRAKDEYLLDAPAESEEHNEWYRQLFYAFLALGMQVRLGAITHEDVKFRVINGCTTEGGGSHSPKAEG